MKYERSFALEACKQIFFLSQSENDELQPCTMWFGASSSQLQIFNSAWLVLRH